MSAVLLDPVPGQAPDPGRKPSPRARQSIGILVALWGFVVLPFVAILAAVPVAWGWGLTWLDVALGMVFYVIGGLGIGSGFHRYLTHGAFKANRGCASR